MARLSVVAITAVAVIAIPEAQAVDTASNAAETEEVTVTGEATGSLTSLSPEEAAQEIILHLEREGFVGINGATG